jgi:hypothetical protein
VAPGTWKFKTKNSRARVVISKRMQKRFDYGNHACPGGLGEPEMICVLALGLEGPAVDLLIFGMSIPLITLQSK